MKVLFAVSNEEISDSIVKKYQKEYKQIISYKNVYYFNAIVKELQKDKTYDRIVISEDLEAFTHTQFEQIDKFIFEKLDSISDEASNAKGDDTPIILICADRRTKSEQMLVKLFGIGVYNAIIGNDRSVEEVCRLINRPRTKKEAKVYYKIDTDNVGYQAENENDVSEMEIQNIVAHYKRLGKNEDRYIDSFNNIAAQYNDTQLRIISKFLPLNVRAVLEEKSQKYQQIMSFNNTVSDDLRRQKGQKDNGPSQKFLKSKNRENIMSKPIVIPSAVDMKGSKKLSRQRQITNQEQIQTQTQPNRRPQAQMPIQEIRQEPKIIDEPQERQIQPIKQMPTQQPRRIQQAQIQQQISQQPVQQVPQQPIQQNLLQQMEQESVVQEIQPVQPVKKRGRGRPRKTPLPEETMSDIGGTATAQPVKKRGRGRPRKTPLPEETMQIQEPEENILPGFEEVDDILNGMPINTPQEEPKEVILPGFEEIEEPQIPIPEPKLEVEPKLNLEPQQPLYEDYSNNKYNNNANEISEEEIRKQKREYVPEIDLTPLLTPDKKIVTFVGTSKNGTSFIVNNIAEQLSSIGINTAILDTTQNRNSYYIYTKNEEPLREIATHSIEGLAQGVARGINVHKNLTVYTSLPNDDDAIYNVDRVLETLLKNYSLVLIDTDFETPLGYFKQSHETYLVQSMDILTIQPLTAFLKELKVKNILDESKLRVVLNKVVKIRGIKDETIIGGMAFYNDPAMSFMTELFDRDRIKYVSIPFEEETYIRYLEGIIECEIKTKGYSKIFLQTLKELGNMVYPIIGVAPRANQVYKPPSVEQAAGNFASVNDTLDRMKRGY